MPKAIWPHRSGPVFCLLPGVSSDYAQPITGQVTEVTCPVIGRAQPELTPSKRQKTGPGCHQVWSHYLNQCWLVIKGACGIHLRATSQEVLMNLTCNMCSDITLVKLLSYLTVWGMIITSAHSSKWVKTILCIPDIIILMTTWLFLTRSQEPDSI